ncbi:glutamyl aminopeptidase [Microdochium trichocladiopsis]|uniref:Aminopeptidase n=1 Tax=Microdochium trichocladiopsis TaxID=1682393 RepID=A0A9P8Y0G3_9PEZI|nr:glutamyl aminopeptidase [Microdochium trichocladiopsis]KAH7024576.1 glutamyl aminopeptidase [Microdochium trichocladiopsis]
MLSKQTTTVEGGFLPTCVTPTHYSLAIRNIQWGDSWKYSGQVTIAATINEPTSRIILHAEGLRVEKADISQNGHELLATNVDTTNGFLTIELPRDISPGVASIHITFQGVVKDSMEGFYRAKHDPQSLKAAGTSQDDGGAGYTLVTQFEPCDARTAFPCFDEPRLKATFELELDIPEGLTALANMPVAAVTAGDSPGTKRVRFEPTVTMSTYLLAWAIGSFEYLERMTRREHQGRKIPVRVYTAPGYSRHARFAVEYAAATLDYFADIFGADYPLPKCDHVVVPEFISGAMENWGLIVYRPPKILFDDETSDNRVKLKACYVIAHELAHQWFGNLVTMDWWNALWLNEGFATWAGYLAVDHFYPEWQIWPHFTANVMSEAFSLDALDATHPIEADVGTTWDARQMFDDISYLKGASVIRMLSQHLGVSVFLKGIAMYLKRHAYGTATTGDLFAALEDVSGVAVSGFMDAWIRRPGFPMVETKPTGSGELHYQQSRFLLCSAKDEGQSPSAPAPTNTVWQIPLQVSAQNGAGQSNVIVQAKQGTIATADTTEVSVLPSDSTFCHFKYSSEERLSMLARQSTLTCNEIIPLLRDIRALVASGHLPIIDMLETCTSLEHNGNVFELGEIAKCLDLLEAGVEGNGRVGRALLDYRRSLSKNQHSQSINWGIKTEEYQAIEYQRVYIQTLLAHEDPDTMRAVEQYYADWAEAREIAFAPSFRGIILGYAVAKLGRPAYEAVKASYVADTTVDGKEVCLSALGRVRDQDLAWDLLDFAFSDKMTLQNVHLVFSSLGASGEGRVYLWEYVKSNWQKVHETLSKCAVVMNWCLEMGLSHFDSAELHEEMEGFFAGKDTSSFHQVLLVVLDRIKANAAVRNRLAPQLREWAGPA